MCQVILDGCLCARTCTLYNWEEKKWGTKDLKLVRDTGFSCKQAKVVLLCAGWCICYRLTCNEEHLHTAVSHVPHNCTPPHHGTRQLIPRGLRVGRGRMGGRSDVHLVDNPFTNRIIKQEWYIYICIVPWSSNRERISTCWTVVLGWWTCRQIDKQKVDVD